MAKNDKTQQTAPKLKHSVEGRLLHRSSTSRSRDPDDDAQFAASKHSAFKRLYPKHRSLPEHNPEVATDPETSPNAARAPEVKSKFARSSDFSVSQLLLADRRRAFSHPSMTSHPVMMGNPGVGGTRIHGIPTASFSDPNLAMSDYWIKYMRALHDGNMSAYLPMFPPCFLGGGPLEAFPSFLGRSSLCGHVSNAGYQLRTDPRSRMRRRETNPPPMNTAEVDRKSATNVTDNSQVETSGLESDVRESDGSEEPQSGPEVETKSDNVDLMNNITSSSPDCYSTLAPLAATNHERGMSYPMTSHPGFLSSVVGFPVSNRRPRDPTKPAPTKKYKCDLCGKAFSRSNTLVTHRRIHTGEKPFKCEICCRAFRQPGNLTRHRLTHTTVKPYVCPICHKAFNRASNLHTHMRTHANFKPYPCHVCGKGFQENVDLRIHLYTHTGKVETSQ